MIEVIARTLVDLPDQVSVKEVVGENTTVIELRVAKSDIGKIIGKEGKTAKAIERARARTVLDLTLTCLRDLLLAREGTPLAGIPHADLAALDLPVARSGATLRAAIDSVLALRRDVESNIDPPLLLDRAFLALAPRAAAGSR